MVGVEESASVGPKLFDSPLGGNGPHSQALSTWHARIESGNGLVGLKVLHDPLAYQANRQHEGQGQKDIERDPSHVDPKIAYRRRGLPG